jgi:hypothetical protein
MRSLLPGFSILALVLTTTPSYGAWIPTGVPLYEPRTSGGAPFVAPDGQGGAFITWDDLRAPSTYSDDVYMQRVTSNGDIAQGWPSTGLPVCALPSTAYPEGLLADGTGGALVAWLDTRNSEHIYLERIQADGSPAPGWPVNGAPASLASQYQNTFAVVSDGSGGAFLAWEDTRNYPATHQYDIYAQHVLGDGTIALNWPPDGAPVCVSPIEKGVPSLAADGTGGVVVAWTDARNGRYSIFAQHLQADATIAPGWALNGIDVSPGRAISLLVADAGAGFYVFSGILDPRYPGYDEFDLQRLTFAGATAPGWPTAGIKVCGASNFRAPTGVLPDGFGGVLMSWYDYRPPYTGGAIFALRVQADGTLVPGWTPDGTLVSNPNPTGYPYGGRLVTDGTGGAYVLWTQSSDGGGTPAYVQHLTGIGSVAPGWLPFGARVAPSLDQADANMGADGQGGVIVAWGENCCGRSGVWAQRFGVDGPVPVEASLVSANVNDGRVDLDWFAGGTSIASATVSRRTDNSAWSVLASVYTDGTGHVRFEDRDVIPGARYGYRLGFVDQGVQRYTTETWVDVPQHFELALAGARPNPSAGHMNVAFSLRDDSPASLAMVDVAGREVMNREVNSLGPGSHVVPMESSSELAPGLYWLRLTQSGRSLLARAVIVR